MTLKIGEIMWVHPDLAKDEQWDSKKPKPKRKILQRRLCLARWWQHNNSFSQWL